MQTHELNGTGRLPRDAKPRARKPVAETGPGAKPGPVADPLVQWARAGVLAAIVLSAGLNGYANAEHAAAGASWAGWLLGVWVPAMVLIFARVAGGCYARGWRLLAGAGGCVVLALLGLSVRHCAHSFGVLTGADELSAVLMALGIDCGLVVCELVTVARKGR